MENQPDQFDRVIVPDIENVNLRNTRRSVTNRIHHPNILDRPICNSYALHSPAARSRSVLTSKYAEWAIFTVEFRLLRSFFLSAEIFHISCKNILQACMNIFSSPSLFYLSIDNNNGSLLIVRALLISDLFKIALYIQFYLTEISSCFLCNFFFYED